MTTGTHSTMMGAVSHAQSRMAMHVQVALLRQLINALRSVETESLLTRDHFMAIVTTATICQVMVALRHAR